MILLDTHIWVRWIINGNQDLSEKIVQAMTLDTHLAVSAISCMEVSLLEKRGKLKLPLTLKDWLKEALENSGVESLPVTCDIMHKAVHFPIFIRIQQTELLLQRHFSMMPNWQI